MFTDPAIDAVGTGLIGRGHFDLWRSRVRGLPEASGELPVSALREEIETPGDGQIRAMLTVAGNPVLSTPDGTGADRALTGLDFMAAVDIYVNETTRHADVILPPTTALERDHYDLVFHLLAVRNTARFTPAVFEKADDTAARLGDLPRGRAAHHRAPREARRAPRGTARPPHPPGPADRVPHAPLVDLLLRRGRSGLTLKTLRARPEGVDLGPLRPGALPRRLQTRNGRLDLAPALVLGDLARLSAVPSRIASSSS